MVFFFIFLGAKVKLQAPADPSDPTILNEVSIQLGVGSKTWVPKHGWNSVQMCRKTNVYFFFYDNEGHEFRIDQGASSQV